MNKYIKTGILVCSMFCLTQQSGKDVVIKAAEYSASDSIDVNSLKMSMSDGTYKIQSEKNDLVILENMYDYGLEDEEYGVISEERIKPSGKVLHYKTTSFKSFRNYVFACKKQKLYVANTSNKSINIKVINKKNGRITTLINQKYDDAEKLAKTINVFDVFENDKKIYCITQNWKKDDIYQYYLKIYDTLKKKWVKSKKIKGDYLKFESGKLYMKDSNKVIEYTLNGTLSNKYTLPKGQTKVGVGKNSTGECYGYLPFEGCDVKKNKIYYCNKEGIYLLNMKNEKVHRIYNPKGDSMFSQKSENDEEKLYGLCDLKILDNGDLYLVFVNEDDSEMERFSQIKKYVK